MTKVAAVSTRVFAYLIDLVVFVPVSVLFGWFIRDHRGGSRVLLAIASLVPSATYEIVTIALWGQTIGKAMRHVRVARPDADRVGVRAALVRWAVRGLVVPLGIVGVISSNVLLRLGADLAGSAWLLVLLRSMTTNRLHRGLHDRAAGTVVIADQMTA